MLHGQRPSCRAPLGDQMDGSQDMAGSHGWGGQSDSHPEMLRLSGAERGAAESNATGQVQILVSVWT